MAVWGYSWVLIQIKGSNRGAGLLQRVFYLSPRSLGVDWANSKDLTRSPTDV